MAEVGPTARRRRNRGGNPFAPKTLLGSTPVSGKVRAVLARLETARLEWETACRANSANVRRRREQNLRPGGAARARQSTRVASGPGVWLRRLLFDCCGTKQALSYTKWFLGQDPTGHTPRRGAPLRTRRSALRGSCVFVAESAGVYTPSRAFFGPRTPSFITVNYTTLGVWMASPPCVSACLPGVPVHVCLPAPARVRSHCRFREPI